MKTTAACNSLAPIAGLVVAAAAACGPVAAPPAAPVPADRIARPAPVPAPDAAFPAPEVFALTNGLEVSVIRRGRLPLLHLLLVVRAGLSAEPPALTGLADFTAEMLKEGTTGRTGPELLDALEDVGGSLAIATDQDAVYLRVTAPSEHAAAAAGVLAEMVRRPAFPDAAVEKHRAGEMNRLRLARSDPEYVARFVLHGALYGSHPYARPDATPASIALIRRDHLVTFHRDRYAPDGAFLFAAGDADPAVVVPILEASFGSWRGAAAPPPAIPDAPSIPSRKVLLVDRPGSVQSVILIGNVTVPMGDPDHLALSVANEVLGGSASSRLFMNLRERHGYTYGAYSDLGQTALPSPLASSANVDTAFTAPALAEFFREIRRIRTEAVPEDELASRKAYMTRAFQVRIETPLSVAFMLAQQKVNGLPGDYWDTYRDRVPAVGAQEVRRAADRFVHDDRAVVVVVGVADEIEEACAAWGPVTRVDEEGNPIGVAAASRDREGR